MSKITVRREAQSLNILLFLNTKEFLSFEADPISLKDIIKSYYSKDVHGRSPVCIGNL